MILLKIFIAGLNVIFYPYSIYAEQDADSIGVGLSAPIEPEFSLMWSTAKVIAALGLTLVLLVVAVWIFKKILTFQRIPGFSDGAITFLEVRYIAPKKGIALVKVLKRVYIIGFSEQALTTLGELTREEEEIIERKKCSTDRVRVFKNILSGFTGNKTVKSGDTPKGT